MNTDNTRELADRLRGAEAQIKLLHKALRGRFLGATSLAVVLSVCTVYLSAKSSWAANQADGGHFVQAPFAVVDDDGHIIMMVKKSADQNQIRLYNQKQGVAAIMLSVADGGAFFVGNGKGPSNGMHAGLSVDSAGNGMLELRDGDGAPMADIAKGPNMQGMYIYRPGTGKPAIEAIANADKVKVMMRSLDDVAGGMFDYNGESLQLIDASDVSYAAIGPGGMMPAAPGQTPAKNASRGLTLYNDKGMEAARIGFDTKGGGYVNLTGADDSDALLGLNPVSATGGGQLILTGPNKGIRLELQGAEPVGLYSYTSTGSPATEMSVAATGGRLWLGDNNGTGMLEGGVTSKNHGFLRAGPKWGGPIELTGLPNAMLGR